MSTSSKVVHDIGWGQSPTPRKYTALNGSFVLFARLFQEQYPGMIQVLPLLFLRVSFSFLINFEFFALTHSIPEMIIFETK